MNIRDDGDDRPGAGGGGREKAHLNFLGQCIP